MSNDFENLWGDDFVVPKDVDKAKQVTEKIKKPKASKSTPTDKSAVKKAVKSNSISLSEKLKLIETEVLRVLGKQKDNVIVIYDYNEYLDYLEKALRYGRIAIDTETNNSLDPVTCKIMGLCLYYSGGKQAYIPVNHRNPDTKERLSNQLTESDIKNGLEFLINNKTFSTPFIVTHNGKFDYQVIKCTTGVVIPIHWDTLIGAKLLDENEFSARLKDQYVNKIDPEQEKYSIDHLFEGVEYADVSPEIFALYAATDSMMTDKLYQWQMDKFSDPDLGKVLNLANTIEMPLVQVIAEMELAGMEVDQEYAQKLSAKYHTKLDIIDSKITAELEKLRPMIEAWRLTPEANFQPRSKKPNKDGEYKLQKSKNEQLKDPIELNSPTQLAILFYDILKAPVVNTKSPRGTGEDELEAINKKLKLPICDLIIQRRGVVKLLTTYIDTIPELAKRWPDGRVRTHFNAYGAATGRLSSSDPINFQNIPSHERTIRLLFKAKDGYRICSADFSAQEPRIAAYKAQDEAMTNAYLEGKDLYSVIASISFDKPYEDCLECFPEGTEIMYEGKKVITGHKTHQNDEGKARRTAAKSVLLGTLYGRGAASVGEQLGKTKQEAQEIIDTFFKSFPSVKNWIDSSIKQVHEKGYVEDVAGRRRRLPDAQLPKYKIIDNNLTSGDFNPFIGCINRSNITPLITKYQKKCDAIKYFRDYERIKKEAEAENVEIHSNTGFIAQAERQAVNAQIQGSAASLTKAAMIDIFKDTRLRELGAYLINTVHDEILIEAPEDVAEEAAKRLCEVMINSAKPFVPNIPMAVDPEIESCWYLSQYRVQIADIFKSLISGNVKKGIAPMTEQDAFEYMCTEYCESTRSQIYELVKGFLHYIPEDVDTSYTSL